jgi:hypothetical protein
MGLAAAIQETPESLKVPSESNQQVTANQSINNGSSCHPFHDDKICIRCDTCNSVQTLKHGASLARTDSQTKRIRA